MIEAAPEYPVKEMDTVRLEILKSVRADKTVRALLPETSGPAKWSYARMLGRSKPPARWSTASWAT